METRGPEPREPERGWLGLSAAARYTGLDREALREAVNAGDLVARARPVSKRQRARRANDVDRAIFSVRALDEWLESQPEITFA